MAYKTVCLAYVIKQTAPLTNSLDIPICGNIKATDMQRAIQNTPIPIFLIISPPFLMISSKPNNVIS
jgi:hypothetical protein